MTAKPTGRPRMGLGPQCPEFDCACLTAYTKLACRCQSCTTAYRAYQLAYKKKKHGQPVPRGKHGTSTAYKAYGCRCKRCVAWSKAYQDVARRRAGIPKAHRRGDED